jgi:DNA-binding transcriptional ArsR family regulator
VTDAVLAAVSDPTRWRVLSLVAAAGEASATTLAARLPVSRPAVIKHLRVLDRAGLVTSRRAGREVRYAARPDRLAATARWMAAIASEWEERLAALKRLAEAQDGDEPPGEPITPNPRTLSHGRKPRGDGHARQNV